MFYSAAFCLRDCPLPAELELQLFRTCPALTDLAWQCVCGGVHFINEPFSKGSVSSVPGKSLLPWGYWLSLSCKRDATSIESPSRWKPGWLPVVTWSSYHPPQNQVAFKQRFVNSSCSCCAAEHQGWTLHPDAAWGSSSMAIGGRLIHSL